MRPPVVVRVRTVGVRATLQGAWLSAQYRRRGIAEINRRLLLADRCEELLARFGAIALDYERRLITLEPGEESVSSKQ